MKYLSFDIECLPINGAMPKPDTSPIILISCCFSQKYLNNKTMVLVGKKNPYIKYNESSNSGKDINWFNSEEEMIEYFFNVIKLYDPDIITGYNIKEFDIPYIIDRSKILYLKNISFSRDGSIGHFGKYGITTKIEFSGRLVVDVFPLIKKDFNLKQYTLKNVSRELINKEKLDISPQDMEKYWKSNDEKLLKFIDYSRRDSELALSLLLDLKLLDKYISLSQITNTITQDIVDGGQTLMVEQVLLKEYLKQDRVMSLKPTEKMYDSRLIENESLKGGEVLEPHKGLHEDVIILDYKSLYPTIMMAYNLCYTTVIKKDYNLSDLDLSIEDVVCTPSGSIFVKQCIFKGIIPSILENLLNQRNTIISKINQLSNEDEIYTQNMMQQAIKILLNSYYGYSGYVRARLYSIEVANAVTSIGRQNIENTKKIIVNETNKILVEECKIWNIELDVIYGDTDSIFIKCILNNKLINECDQYHSIDDKFEDYLNLLLSIGKKIAIFVTKKLPYPMELEFEAIAKRVLLIAKKRYAQWLFEKHNDKWKNKIKVKGMETIRRDWCELTSSSLSQVLELILIDGNVEKAINYVNQRIKDVQSFNSKENKTFIEQLILTKNYSKSMDLYKNKQPHITVVKKIYKRTGQIIPLGTRIPYVIVFGKELFVERAEDPNYVLKNNILIDVNYYVNKQLLPPIERIFDCLGINNKLIINENFNQKKLFDFENKELILKKNKKKKELTKINKIEFTQKSILDF